MSDIGSTLRSTREAKGISLLEAEASTRIRIEFLQALEEDDFEAIGGDLYLRGFLKNYAGFLGLDPEPMLQQLGSTSPALPVSKKGDTFEPRYLAEPLEVNPLPLGRIMLMLIGLLLLGGIGISLWWQPTERDILLARFGLAEPLPTPTQSGEGPATADNNVISRTIIIEPYSTPTPEGLATPVPTATLPPREQPGENNAPSEPQPEPQPELQPEPAQLVSGIVITAQVLADTWVRVQVDSDNQPVLERTLRPGETFEWTGEQQITLRVGNAGGLSLTLNGQELGVLGSSGQVVERQWFRSPDSGEPVQADPQG